MSEKLQQVLETLGYKVSKGSAQDDKGRAIPLLTFKHGVHQLVAFEEDNGVQIAYPMDIRPEDTALLEKQPDEIMGQLFSILKREVLEGRTAYVMATTETENPKKWKALKQIRVSQKVIVADTEPHTLQRVADGIQEIVVVAVRCQLVMGEALRSVATATKISTTTYHDAMYR